jgi:hypothetical protein
MDKVETDSSVLFKDDSDRHAWRVYAAAALQGLLVSDAPKDYASLGGAAADAAEVADAMLAEERKRRR